MHQYRFYIRISILSIAFIFSLSACSNKIEEIKINTVIPNVSVLYLNELPQYEVSEIASIKAFQEVELFAKSAGFISNLAFKIGDLIQKGEVLARIDTNSQYDPAKINLNNAELKSQNAHQTRDEILKNNQELTHTAQLRTNSLETNLGRLQRNLKELYASNKTAKETLNIQIKTAKENLDNAQINQSHVDEQFNQLWKDTLNTAENDLDSVFTHLESKFSFLEDIINPSNQLHFSNSDLNHAFGVRDSKQRSLVITLYRSLREDLKNGKERYKNSLKPINKNRINDSIKLALNLSEAFRDFSKEMRIMMENSVENTQTKQSSINTYLSQITGIEDLILRDISNLNRLEKILSNLKIDENSQSSLAENNLDIAKNQLNNAENAKLDFNIKSSASIKNLENQIKQTNNDLLSAQSNLASTERTVVIKNKAKDLEINTLNNQVRLAKKVVDDNQIKSSIDGTLSELFVDTGDYVMPGKYLAKIIQYKKIKLIFYLPKDLSAHLYIGQNFTFSTQDSKEHVLSAKIEKIAPSADSLNKKIRIEGIADNTNFLLKPETFVNVYLDLSKQIFNPSKIYIPINAVIFSQNEAYVFVLEGENAVRHNIVIGKTYGKWLEVKSGLKKGDILLVEGFRNLDPNKKTPVKAKQMNLKTL